MSESIYFLRKLNWNGIKFDTIVIILKYFKLIKNYIFIKIIIIIKI